MSACVKIESFSVLHASRSKIQYISVIDDVEFRKCLNICGEDRMKGPKNGITK